MTTNLTTAYERITNLERDYSTLKTKYTRDVKNLANVVRGSAFSSGKGDPTITLTGTKIKYPATGSYHGNENCEWTIDAGSVTYRFLTSTWNCAGVRGAITSPSSKTVHKSTNG